MSAALDSLEFSPTRTSPHAVLAEEVEDRLAKLTDKQALFVREYLVDLNATQAAIRAGYSKKASKEIGYENLTKPHLWECIELAMELKVARVDVSVDWIEHEYVKLYRSAVAEGDKAVARQCLKDLGEHHAMFVKVVASVDAGNLSDRLKSARTRINADNPRSPSHARYKREKAAREAIEGEAKELK